jgi:hypothetical protein
VAGPGTVVDVIEYLRLAVVDPRGVMALFVFLGHEFGHRWFADVGARDERPECRPATWVLKSQLKSRCNPLSDSLTAP